MAPNFPDPVGAFDEGRACVSFWGSDASIEFTFQIEIDALRKFGASEREAQLLATFGGCRDTI